MQTAILLVLLAAMLLAWIGRRWIACGTFVVALVTAAYWLRHHMTDALPLQF